MKRVVFIFLAIVMCVSLCACGQNTEEKIIEELESKSWRIAPFLKYVFKFEDGMCTTEEYTFDDNYRYENTPLRSHYGSYWISDFEGNRGKIQISFSLIKERGDYDYKVNEGNHYRYLYFTYENGFLEVFWDEEMTEELK